MLHDESFAIFSVTHYKTLRLKNVYAKVYIWRFDDTTDVKLVFLEVNTSVE